MRDPETGERRRVRRADVEGMAALCEVLPNIDFVMSMGLPEDAPQGIDDLIQVVAMLRGTRKPLLVAPRDGSVLARMQEMAALCGEKDSFGIYAMPSPPLMHDPDALTKVIGCAELLIPLVYAPAPNMGATGPRSIAGAVLVGNAETLSGLVLHQHVRRGAPFVYGIGAGAMDMRTMTDPYVSPDALLAQQVGTDMARHYGLPSFSYAGMSDSKLLDEQWSAEAALSMAYGSLSRATLLHDVGYLESGLQSSYESIVLGDELVGYARQFMREVPVDDYSLALDEIRAAGSRRQPPRDEVHAPAPPGVLDAGASRPCRPRPLGRRRRYDSRRPRARAPRRPPRRRAGLLAHRRAGRPSRGAPRRGARRPGSARVTSARGGRTRTAAIVALIVRRAEPPLPPPGRCTLVLPDPPPIQVVTPCRMSTSNLHKWAMLPDPTPADLARAAAGDADAFRTIVERYQGMVYSVAYNVLGNHTDAEDAAQEAFLRCYRKLAQYRGEATFSTWLFRLALTASVDYQRRERRRPEPVEVPDVAGGGQPSSATASAPPP